jgi:mxaJ protein
MNNLPLSVALVAATFAMAFAEAAAAGPAALHGRKLVVCTDPNNLPFSNQAGEGFENKLAKLLADDMGANLTYVWWAQRRGFARIDNVRGYMLYGDYEKPNPPAAIVAAVARGEVDVALVWGPLAGYFASLSSVALRVEPVTPTLDDSQWPMVYDISMGVRRDNLQLREQIESILSRERPRIDALLSAYHVPQVAPDR